ncbi:hypothetical protein GLOIN_2v1765488 [Rhizophagus irregularis DAOM 181602=DAOM 197198]|nr:hypothetical protein GLOIN_2v1765488 [Rhizophagus irregularis DAOM 181602=DAOM 197198]
MVVVYNVDIVKKAKDGSSVPINQIIHQTFFVYGPKHYERNTVARTTMNPMFTKDALLALIRGQAGFAPFPPQAPSDCAFSFNDRQAFLNTTIALTNNNWSRHMVGFPDVGRCYEIGIPKKG